MGISVQVAFVLSSDACALGLLRIEFDERGASFLDCKALPVRAHTARFQQLFLAHVAERVPARAYILYGTVPAGASLYSSKLFGSGPATLAHGSRYTILPTREEKLN